MAPLYLLTLIFFAVMLVQRARIPVLPWPAGWTVLGMLLVLLSGTLPAIIPVPRLPDPGGPYTIGTATFDWTDLDRSEIYSDGAGSPRRILVQVWYPAENAPFSRRAPYLRDVERVYPALAKEYDMPPFVFSHLTLGKTHAVEDSPVVDGIQRFPVLVFSHGWTGIRVQNTYQMEALASHGYVIFSADHTYGAAAVAFPDGTLAMNYPEALPKNVPDAVYDTAARKLGQTWVEDIRFILDQAALLDSGDIESRLTGRLDLERVGIFGHSTGGGAAVEVCYVDPRCTAGLAMDAWLIPYDREIIEAGLNQPFLFMNSEHWRARRNPPLADRLFKNMMNDSYHLVIVGAYHDTFADIAQFMPLIDRLRRGSLLGLSPQFIVNAYTLDFFDHNLKNQPAIRLAPGVEALPGVQIERRER